MILALDTSGAIYLSLLQSNSNTHTMELFIIALANKLDSERSDWRTDTILMFDNASYHVAP